VTAPLHRAVASDVPAVEVRAVSKSFGEKRALDGVSLSAWRGAIHALLGPNGAGKTTLLGIMTGLVEHDAGEIVVEGVSEPARTTREARGEIGLVPSGDRTFYLRISGYENLLFFARLQGVPKREAARRARARLSDVGLDDASSVPVGEYSHGMQKRLAIARALLVDAPLLFVDEATHDLDPAGAAVIRGLVARAANDGAAVVWTTQRIEEIRGFADDVTVLSHGRVRFQGSVHQLLARATTRVLVLELRAAGRDDADLAGRSAGALRGIATVDPIADGEGRHIRVRLAHGMVLGRVVRALDAVDIDVVSSRDERSDIETAFLALTEDPP
jgi:ABC-2 type transport system ATP-binding protein